jgi:hypothetical protein
VIVSAGVLVPLEVAPHLAVALAEYLARYRPCDPALFELVAELQAVAMTGEVTDRVTAGHESFSALDGWLTIAEAADAWGMNPRTLRRHARRGLIPARIEKNQWRLPPNQPIPT